MASEPKFVLVYPYVLNGAIGYKAKSERMVKTYLENPSGYDHETVVVCNGHKVTDEAKLLFEPLPNLTFIEHDNTGWDLGAFQLAAKTITADIMMFLGGSVYFRKPNWLLRAVNAYLEHGPTLYGACADMGAIPLAVKPNMVWPHIRTCSFWCPPSFINDYPKKAKGKDFGGDRYLMEHGPFSLTAWCISKGYEPMVVSFYGTFTMKELEKSGSYHVGNQEALLIGDSHTEPPFWHCS